MACSFCEKALFTTIALALFGCSSGDGFTASVAGVYTVAITNEHDTCNFQNWEEGKETTGIELSITQNDTDIHGTLGGVVGAFFTLAFGSAEFDGSIHGNSFELDNYGSRSMTSGNCVYTYNSSVDGTQNGDSISGTITYASKTNGNPDCDAIECSASQKFSGSRPPK
jgi:hypothetical protein